MKHPNFYAVAYNYQYFRLCSTNENIIIIFDGEDEDVAIINKNDISSVFTNGSRVIFKMKNGDYYSAEGDAGQILNLYGH